MTRCGQVPEIWIWCFKFPNGYIWKTVCLVSNYDYLDSIPVTETVMDAATLRLSLSLFLLRSTKHFHRECTCNIRVQHSWMQPCVESSDSSHLLGRFVSRLSVLFPFHWCSQRRVPLRWHNTPLWGHLAGKNCYEGKEQCASHIICGYISSTNLPRTWEQVFS